jgi:spore germination protein KC
MSVRRLMVILLIITSMVQTGCWDMREINEIGFVLAIGIDFSPDTKNYTVTVQIANPIPGQSNGKKTDTTESTWNCIAEGGSVFEAVRNLARISSKRLTWSHNTIIVLGEALAKSDVTAVLDFFTTSPELRMKTAIVVSKGIASDYITSHAGSNPIAGLSLGDLFANAPLTAVSIQSDVKGVYSAFTSDYSQMLICGITMKKKVISSDEQGNISKNNTIALEGAAVFKKSKMIGWLTPEEARGVAWVLNNTKDTIVNVSDTDTKNRTVSIETKNVKCKIISEIDNGIPSITIKITGRGNVVEEDGPSSMEIIEFQNKIQKLLNKKISYEIQKGIDKVQKDYESDVLGFAQIVRVQNNNSWEERLKNEWQDTFPIIPIKTDVNINIVSNTLKQETIHETKGK